MTEAVQPGTCPANRALDDVGVRLGALPQRIEAEAPASKLVLGRDLSTIKLEGVRIVKQLLRRKHTGLYNRWLFQ
jgi:hypothetical protein